MQMPFTHKLIVNTTTPFVDLALESAIAIVSFLNDCRNMTTRCRALKNGPYNLPSWSGPARGVNGNNLEDGRHSLDLFIWDIVPQL